MSFSVGILTAVLRFGVVGHVPLWPPSVCGVCGGDGEEGGRGTSLVGRALQRQGAVSSVSPPHHV